MAAEAFGDDGRQVSRLLFEAVELVASADVALDLVASTLDDPTLEGPPPSPEALRAFVQGKLLPAVAARLGDDAAEVVRSRLEPVIASWQLSDSQVRTALRQHAVPREESPTRTLRPGAASVLVASREPSLREELEALVGASVRFAPVGDAMDLLRKCEDAGTSARLLVVDCAASPLDVATLIRAATHLPDEVQVLLWRADSRVSLAGLPRACAARWSVVRPPTSVADLATMCAWLVTG